MLFLEQLRVVNEFYIDKFIVSLPDSPSARALVH